ncbi:MAG TPA: molybdenum cofactor biosynthesis protein MoaE [Candidatus Sulfotelmatobacter sp.]|jgi:molybdopterin synthase catalytic subunit
MRVRVLFFGVLKDVVGKAADWIELPEAALLGDVLVRYASQNPRLKELLPSMAMAVNQHYAGPETKLQANDEIALLPPVSGGAPGGADETPARQPAEPALSQTEGKSAGRRLYVEIVRHSIETQPILADLKHGSDGAALVFEGVVRNHTRGRKTLYLDYEAYEEMALEQMQSLARQALQQFPIRDLRIVHRLGRMEIGETSVLIVVASPHRAAAFDACRWLIDTLKRTVPIWKKEYFEDGAVWADGEPFPAEIPRANSGT